MSDSLTPTEGARFLLERIREEAGGAGAVYRTGIYTPNATYEGTATLADDGAATLSDQVIASGGAAEQVAASEQASSGGRTNVGRLTDAGSPTKAPESLVETLLMLAKLTARSASKKREDGLAPWPARILRWRGPGRGE